jgi:hypothetical protein
LAVAPFRELERSYFDLRWHLDPVAASQAGIPAYDDRYGRFSYEPLAPHLAALKSLALALEATEPETLEAEIDRTALLNDARVTVQRFEQERPQQRDPGFWLSHLMGGLHVLLLRQDRSLEARVEGLAARLEDVPEFLDDARATLTAPVRVFAETALRMSGGGLQLIREAVADLAVRHPAQAERLRAAGEGAVAALATFEHDLERWLESGSEHFAVGEDVFNFHLHYEHALRDTAPELWRYGHHLMEELEADLARRAAQFDAGAAWPDVVERLRADHPKGGDLVAAYAREMARSREFVRSRDLVTVPDAPLTVAATPEFMRPLVPFAAYDSPGPYSSDRTGWFWVTTPDPSLPAEQQERMLRDHCRHELGPTALHEGYPGHHLHLVTMQQQASHTRKNLWTPLTVEGWALYCEDMMAEEGFYAGDEERLFQRLHLLWRAVRILLDVGLHTRGMTFEQAVDYLTAHLHVDRANAEAEVRRYCANPSYQLCYAVGRRELLQLRDDYRAAHGPSLRGFHDAVLRYGGLPVSLIRWGLGLGE